MSESVLPAASPPPAPPAGEGCPVPLAWRQVLAAVRELRDEFLLPTSWGDVSLWEFGQGQPLCFLGDAAGDAELFTLAAWLLKDQFRSLLLTFPPFPETVAGEHWLSGTAELLLQTLQSRGYEQVPVYGVGYGALIALQAALADPQRIGPLLLQGSRPDLRWTWRERLLLAIGRRTRRPLGDVPMWGRVVEANHRRWFPPFDSSRWEFLRDNLAATPARDFARRMTSAADPALASRLSEVQSPVFLVRTEGEGLRTTAAQERLAAALPRVQVEWMHSTGQFPYLTHPHRLVKLIRQFLDTVRPPAGQT